MRDDARRLVDGEEMVVFIDDVERKILCRRLAPLGEVRGKRDGDAIAGGEPQCSAAGGLAVDAHRAVVDPGLDACAGRASEIREMAADRQIEPPAGIAAIGHQQTLGHFSYPSYVNARIETEIRQEEQLRCRTTMRAHARKSTSGRKIRS